VIKNAKNVIPHYGKIMKGKRGIVTVARLLATKNVFLAVIIYGMNEKRMMVTVTVVKNLRYKIANTICTQQTA